MSAAALACLPIFFTGARISRLGGILFLSYYVAYTAYVVMGATGAAQLRSFDLAMRGFVIPLTLMGIPFSVYQHRADRGRRA